MFVRNECAYFLFKYIKGACQRVRSTFYSGFPK